MKMLGMMMDFLRDSIDPVFAKGMLTIYNSTTSVIMGIAAVVAIAQLFQENKDSENDKEEEKKLNHDLDRDLDYFSSDIKKMIATEIIKRYYYQRGNIIQQLKDDDGLKEAMKILNDPVKYKEMLSAPAAKE